MFDNILVLRHLVQNQLLNRKQRNEKRGERIEIDQHHGATSGPAASSEVRPTPSTGDLVLLWAVSNFSGKPGM